MPDTLPPDHPNLVHATARLRRNLWVWAGLFLAMAGLVYATLGPAHLLRVAPWLAAAILLALGRQPAYLALVSIFWGLTLINLVPGSEAALGANPLAASLGSEPLEILGYAIIQAIMMVTSWNQFMFYRMLYGTQGATGLDPDSPLIPEVIPNRTDRLAWSARLLGVASLIAAISAIPLARTGGFAWAVEAGLGLSVFAIGLGLGSAYSPTRKRSRALVGILLGAVGFAICLAVNQAFGGSGS